MKYYFRGIIPVLIICIATLLSCKTEDCVTVANNYLLIDYFETDTLETGAVKFTPKDTLFYSVMAVGNDSVFYSKKKKVNSMSLPVNPDSDQTTFEFVMIDSIHFDTLSVNPIVLDTIYHINPSPHKISVNYTRGYKIISESCGVEISYNNLSLEENTFPLDSLIKNNLSRFNDTNIAIYF